MRAPSIVLAAGLPALTLSEVAHAGPLDEVRSEVHAGSPSSEDDEDDEGDDGDDSWSFSGVSLGCESCEELASPPVGPVPGYLPHPYADGVDGYVTQSTGQGRGRGRGVALRLASESSYQYGGLWRVGLAARASAHWLELDSDWSWFRDTTHADSLWIGDANLGLAPLRRPHVVWRVAGGARFLIDSKPAVPGESGHARGWNVSTGVDIFPFDPIVMGGEVDVGRLGQAWLWRLRGTIGMQLSHAEIFAGYDHMQIGAASLGGPMLGLRLWL